MFPFGFAGCEDMKLASTSSDSTCTDPIKDYLGEFVSGRREILHQYYVQLFTTALWDGPKDDLLQVRECSS